MAFKVLGKVVNPKEQISKPAPKAPDSFFDEKEMNFILTKLRSASYTGTEFEMFYSIWLKIMELGPK